MFVNYIKNYSNYLQTEGKNGDNSKCNIQILLYNNHVLTIPYKYNILTL